MFKFHRRAALCSCCSLFYCTLICFWGISLRKQLLWCFFLDIFSSLSFRKVVVLLRWLWNSAFKHCLAGFHCFLSCTLEAWHYEAEKSHSLLDGPLFSFLNDRFNMQSLHKRGYNVAHNVNVHQTIEQSARLIEEHFNCVESQIFDIIWHDNVLGNARS